MKIDHLVINVDEKYQTDNNIIEEIRNAKLPYEPKWGKGTRGFKASNLWIGNEYFEMINILKKNGGGWTADWTEKYNKGHRGLICLMLDVDNIDDLYSRTLTKHIDITKPEWLRFKWFFNLFTREMPWRNNYLPFFQGVPFQIGFQEMKDDKSREFMTAYMVPNARDNGINGIHTIVIKGAYTDEDFQMILSVFETAAVQNGEETIELKLSSNQKLCFTKNDDFTVEVFTGEAEENHIVIENINVYV